MKVAQIWPFVHVKGDKGRGTARKVTFVHIAKKISREKKKRERKEKERKRKKPKEKGKEKERKREEGRLAARGRGRKVCSQGRKGRRTIVSHHGQPRATVVTDAVCLSHRNPFFA